MNFIKSLIGISDQEKTEQEIFEDLGKLPYEGKYYIICLKWLELWKLQPGKVRPITNGRLVSRAGKVTPGLLRKKDYETLNQEQWDFLYEKYGGDAPVIKTVPELYSADWEQADTGNLTDRIDVRQMPTIQVSRALDEVQQAEKEFQQLTYQNGGSFEVSESSSEYHSSLGKYRLSGMDPQAQLDEVIEIKATPDEEEKSTYKPRPGLIGLMEIEGLGFINQGVQFLISSDSFLRFMQETDFTNLGQLDMEKHFTTTLRYLVCRMFDKQSGILRPDGLLKCLMNIFGATCDNYSLTFIEHAIKTIDKEIVLPNERQSAIIANIFLSAILQSETCQNCGKHDQELVGNVYLTVKPRQNDISDAINEDLGETIKPMYCQDCRQDMYYRQSKSIHVLADTLILFIENSEELSSGTLTKAFRKDMDIKAGINTISYRLKAVMTGETSTPIAICKRGHQYYKFQDARIEKAKLKEVLKQQPFMLMYEKIKNAQFEFNFN